jgi:hemerythrin
LDDQHKGLVDILNRLFVAVAKQEGDKAIVGTLDSLMSYTEQHFALEESLMQKVGYADFEAHKAEHTKLIGQLDQFCKKHSLEEKPIYFEMLSFLKIWLKEHILGVDRKYRTALKKFAD